MNSVTYFIPYPRDNSTKTYSILLIPFGFVAYFSDGKKSKNSVNFLVVSCAVVYIRACTSSNIAHHCNDEYQVVLLHQYMYDGVKQGYWMRLCFKELRIFVVYLFCPRQALFIRSGWFVHTVALYRADPGGQICRLVSHSVPTDTSRNNDVVITSKWRHFHVIASNDVVLVL